MHGRKIVIPEGIRKAGVDLVDCVDGAI